MAHAPDSGPITRRLQASRASGIEDAELLSLVYADLRQLAARQLGGERGGHTLSPTALVNECYLRLAGDASLRPEDRRQFFAIAARRMRQVLVDHARRRDAAKRGGPPSPAVVTLDGLAAEARDPVDALSLEQALVQLETLDPRKARVVELRYFTGLEMSEIAELLQVSRATVQRDWDVARSFLFQALR